MPISSDVSGMKAEGPVYPTSDGVTAYAFTLPNGSILHRQLQLGKSPKPDTGKKKRNSNEDPMSHRKIEKRRRDRMNNCLSDLSRLIPSSYVKKGRGRIEKTEIIEMAIRHMKHLQAHTCRQIETCDLAEEIERGPAVLEHYRMGFQECMSESMHFLIEQEGFYAEDSLCVRLMNHLQKHCEKITKVGQSTVNSENLSATSTGVICSMNGNVGSSSNGCSSGNGSGNVNSTEVVSVVDSEPVAGRDVQLSPVITRVSQDMVPNYHHSLTPPFSPSRQEMEDCELHSRKYSLSDNEGLSQLREMLRKPLSADKLQRSELPSTVTSMVNISMSSGSSTNGNKSTDENGALYKFKTNIKQRFTADMESSTNDCSKEKRQRLDCDGIDMNCDIKRQKEREYSSPNTSSFSSPCQTVDSQDNDTHSLTSNSPHLNGNTCYLTPQDQVLCEQLPNDTNNKQKIIYIEKPQIKLQPKVVMDGMLSVNTKYQQNTKIDTESPSPPVTEGKVFTKVCQSSCKSLTPDILPQGIPIFALNTKGSFYVPLTVDQSILSPYLSLFSENATVLHPVTISVNFCGPFQSVFNTQKPSEDHFPNSAGRSRHLSDTKHTSQSSSGITQHSLLEQWAYTTPS